jgi:hypothetical protein
VTIPALAQGPEHDQVVASIHLQRVVTEEAEEEEGVAPAVEPGAVEGGE